MGTTRLCDVRRGLRRFDVTGLPPGTVVTSAVVRLWVTLLPAFSTPQHSNVALYPVGAPWGEGTGTGNQGTPAQAGDATRPRTGPGHGFRG